MATPIKTPKDYTGQEFVITREFAAPRELVFAAWTDPKHVAQWWGPGGFTNPTCEWDARPGGKIYDVMRGPNGQEYPMGGEFREIKPPERVVLSCGPLDDKGKMLFEFLHDVTFTESAGKTKMVLRSKVLWTTPEASHYISGFEMGMGSSLDRLAELVKETVAWPFVITHEFAAPRELVWKAWTEEEHLAKWFGPKGFKIIEAKLDFRKNGSFHYCIAKQGGGEMWGKFVYREIVPPEKLVWMFSFSDKDGGQVRHPFSTAPWSQQMINEATFTENDGKTTVILKSAPFEATAEESQTFKGATGSMAQGWQGTLTQLTEYLAKLQS